MSYATGGFFLAATVMSWRATRDAKRELVYAVDAFNAQSPHKIEAEKRGIDFLEDPPSPQE
jgi:hypothetical protein